LSTLSSRRRRSLLIGSSAVLIEVVAIWQRGYGLGGKVVVRCRRNHLFTTIWVPAVSLKSLRLGWWRVQWCPVGRHWSLVTPVRQSGLTKGEKRIARKHRDIRIP
jgi:hypothetical protein